MTSPHDYTIDNWINWVNEVLDGISLPDRDRYTPINQGSDRHGVLEWSYFNPANTTDPLERLVSVGVIPDVATDTAIFEFRFGARFEDRYLRRPSTEIEVSMGTKWETVENPLREAMQLADSLEVADLRQMIPSLLW